MMSKLRVANTRTILSLVVLVSTLSRASAQRPDTGEPAPTDELALGQSQIADKYARLETLMLRMAEFDATTNPRRSALLKQALQLSKQKHVYVKVDELTRLLNQKRLARAIEQQQIVRSDMKELLDLLLSENRADRLKNEKQRIREYIKEVERILRQQRGVQGRTEGGDDAAKLAQEQDRIAERTGRLGSQIDENEGLGQDALDSSNSAGEDARPADTRSREEATPGRPSGTDENAPGQTETPKDDTDDPSAGDSAQEETTPGDSADPDGTEDTAPSGSDESPANRPGENAQPGTPAPSQDNAPSDASPSNPQPGGPGGSPPPDGPQPESQDSFPGRKRIAAAEQRMRDAQRKLDRAERDEAGKEQERARRLLEEAKAELERILRQMREEEVERMLALLESRCRKMLEMQLKVYEETKRLDATPSDKRDRRIDIQAGKLSLQQRRIVSEAERAILVLREEGSSVAFPEALSQMREDMQQVADRLAAAKIGKITQGIEEDVIAALEEMIEALEQAQQDQEERKQQNQQQSQPGQPQDPSLVDAIAELKLIKSLQVRVNRRTVQYSKLLDNTDDVTGQATDSDLVDALQKLSDREVRIFRTTRDIVLGKNR